MRIHAAVLQVTLCAIAPWGSCLAQEARNPLESRIDVVQITATRFGEPVQEVPLSISVVTHDELVARGANDLRTALAALGGAAVVPGGDAGPASAVPALLGVREADDFLLLIDGVPAGGAFASPFETASLNNVERIEVLRGAAPVYFGTTAFAGTINIIHYKAGSAQPDWTVTAGGHGSVSVAGAVPLSTGTVKQSLALELSRDRLGDRRAGFDRAQANYRLATPLAGGDFRFDAHLQVLDQKPGSPTPVGEDGRLTSEVPADFNQNPGDGHLNSQRHQLVLGYGRSLAIGRWDSTLSWTETHLDAIQGFLVDGGLDITEGDNALGTAQSRFLHDLYFDTHVTTSLAPWIDLTYGLNEIRGRADQSSQSFGYRLPLDGSVPGSLASGTPEEDASLRDRRSFFGAYVQSRLRPTADISVLAGLRWNRTIESRHTDDDVNGPLDQSQRTARLNGSLGASWEAWRDKSGDLDDVALYASLGNTFQAPRLDFGIDAGADPLLRAETQRSVTFGIKADGDDGRFEVDLGAFLVNFDNQAVTAEVDGKPVLQSGGRERFKGVEIETAYRPTAGLTISGHASVSQARYRQYTTLVADTPTVLDGRSIALNPKLRVGAAVAYAPERGLGASITGNFTGSRFLDSLNTVRAPGFTTLDASLSWRFERFTMGLVGSNLTNRRDALLASELGEGQIYRMPARRVFASLSVRL